MDFITFLMYYLASKLIYDVTVSTLLISYRYIQIKRLEKEIEKTSLSMNDILKALDKDDKTWN